MDVHAEGLEVILELCRVGQRGGVRDLGTRHSLLELRIRHVVLVVAQSHLDWIRGLHDLLLHTDRESLLESIALLLWVLESLDDVQAEHMV